MAKGDVLVAQKSFFSRFKKAKAPKTPAVLDSNKKDLVRVQECASSGWFGDWVSGKNKGVQAITEDYAQNELMYLTIPTLTMSVDARGTTISSKGFVISDSQAGTSSDEEVAVENLMTETLKFDNVTVANIETSLNLKGNAIFWVKWEDDEPVKLTMIPFEFVRCKLGPDGAVETWRYSLCKDFKKETNDPLTGFRSLEPWEVVHINRQAKSGRAVGISRVQPIRETLKNKRDLNIILPVIVKHYAKPMIIWQIQSEHSKIKGIPGKIRLVKNHLLAMFKTLEPDSDIIITDYVKPIPINVPITYPEKYIQETNRDILGVINVPESLWFAEGSTDQKTQIQTEMYLTSLEHDQNVISDAFYDQLIKVYMTKKFPNSDVTPKIVFNEMSTEDTFKTAKSVTESFDSGLLTQEEGRRLLPWELEEVSDEDTELIVDKQTTEAADAVEDTTGAKT